MSSNMSNFHGDCDNINIENLSTECKVTCSLQKYNVPDYKYNVPEYKYNVLESNVQTNKQKHKSVPVS